MQVYLKVKPYLNCKTFPIKLDENLISDNFSLTIKFSAWF